MSDQSWPTEAMATTAVDAAARAAYGAGMRPLHGSGLVPPTWGELDAVTKRNAKESVLPVVWAALSALPDPRHTAWLEGYIAADNGRDAELNPYAAS